MQSNARGLSIILNAVTPATFRGPPIVACSADYLAAQNTLGWSKILDLAAQLDVPAIHIDHAHDGGVAFILPILSSLLPFFTPGFTPPWIHSSGSDLTSYPIPGPIFYLDTEHENPGDDDDDTGGGVAVSLTEQSINFRRNHLYGFAMDAVWPVSGEHLDRVQRPPIHRFSSSFFDAGNYFIETILPQWLAPQLLAGQTYKDALVLGITELQAHAASYPGIVRHVNPLYVRQDTTDNLFAWPWLA